MKFLRFLAIALVLLSVNIASATSTYSDRLVGVNSGLAVKVPVKVAAMSAITLSGEKTIDDIACVDGDRVLVTANGVDSGIYIVHTGAWTRAVDWDGQGDVVSGTRVSISQGTQYANITVYITTPDPIVIGTTDLTFEISIPIREATSLSALSNAANYKSLIPVTAQDGTVSLWMSTGTEWKKLSGQNTTTTDSPAITSIIPATGNISGGYSAVIYGSNFVANSTVSIGGTNATIGAITSSSITITVPAHSAGTADIVITSPTNTIATSVGGFTYTEPVLPLPVISSISSGTPTTTGATITFNTDVATTSWVQWGLTTAYSDTNFPGDASNTAHSHALSGLLPESTYHYLITVLDGNGNLVSSADGTFVTAAPVSFPVISAISSGVPSDTTATITFTTDVNTDSYIEYGETTAYGTSTTINPTLTTSHSVSLTGLMSGTTYHYKIHVRDGTTFAETTSTDQTFATSSSAPPVGSLTISNINVSNISQTSATINWTLSGAGTGYWEMGTVSGTFTSTNSPGETTLNYSTHAQIVTGLTPGTTYYYRVRSTNSAGLETISSINNFTTLSGTVTGTPALVNPVNPMNYGAACDGATNDKEAFKSALAVSDVLVPAGKTCVINGGIDITVSNKHIECGAGTVLKQTVTGGNVFTYTAPAGVRITGDSIVNCTFIGTGTIPASTDWNNPAKHWNIPILTRDRVDNFILIGNTFDRFYGQSMFQTNGDVDGGHGDQIVYNTFKNCGYYGPVFVAHANGYMAHNTMTDCSIGVENDDGGQVTGGNIIEYNTVGVIYGSGDGVMGASALLTGGCTGNLTNDIRNYSANIVRNNAISGVSNAQGAYPNAPSRLYICTKWLASYAAQYSNNSCTNGCEIVQ